MLGVRSLNSGNVKVASTWELLYVDHRALLLFQMTRGWMIVPMHKVRM